MKSKSIPLSLLLVSVYIFHLSGCGPIPSHHLAGLQEASSTLSTNGMQDNHGSTVQKRKESAESAVPVIAQVKPEMLSDNGAQTHQDSANTFNEKKTDNENINLQETRQQGEPHQEQANEVQENRKMINQKRKESTQSQTIPSATGFQSQLDTLNNPVPNLHQSEINLKARRSNNELEKPVHEDNQVSNNFVQAQDRINQKDSSNNNHHHQEVNRNDQQQVEISTNSNNIEHQAQKENIVLHSNKNHEQDNTKPSKEAPGATSSKSTEDVRNS